MAVLGNERSEVTEGHAELKEVIKKIKEFQGKNS